MYPTTFAKAHKIFISQTCLSISLFKTIGKPINVVVLWPIP